MDRIARGFPHRSVMIAIVIYAVVLFALYTAQPAGGSWPRAAMPLLVMGAFLSAGFLSLQTADRLGSAGRCWRWFGASSLATAVGWGLRALTPDSWLATPGFSVLIQVAFLQMFPLYLVAAIILLRGRRAGSSPLTALLEGFIMTGIVALLLYEMAIIPGSWTDQQSTPDMLRTIGWPAGSLGLTVLYATLSRWRTKPLNRQSLILIVLGLGSIAIANVTFSRLSLAGTATTGHLLELGWASGALFVAIAAAMATPDLTSSPVVRPPTLFALVGNAMPMGLSVIALGALSVYVGSHATIHVVTRIGIYLFAVLISIRLMIALVNAAYLGWRTGERDRLVAVVDASRAVAGEVELDALLSQLVRAAAHGVDRARAEVYIYTEDGSGRVEASAVHGFPEEEIELFTQSGNFEAPLTDFPAEVEVVATGMPVVQFNGWPGIQPEVERLFATAGKELTLIAPLIAHGRVVGSFNLWTPHSLEPFTDTDMTAVAAIGQQAGLAIHNSRLLAASRRHAAELRKREASLAEAQQLAHIGSWEWDSLTDALIGSDEWFRILGLEPTRHAVSQKAIREMVHPDDLVAVNQAVETVLQTRRPFDHECRIIRPDGAVRIVHIRGAVSTDDAGTSRHLVGYLQDITRRKAAEARLAHQAYHDALTDLPNRTYFFEQLAKSLKRTRQERSPSAVLFLDLDGFKVVNDSLGHAAGDHLLIAVGRRLQSVLPENVLLARLGGDEFAVLLEGFADASVPIRLGEELIASLDPPFMIDGHEAFITASIGVAIRSRGAGKPGEMLRDADIALFRAKATGRSSLAVFHPRMRVTARARLERETALRRAIERQELQLVFQPTVELATGRIVGSEALVRWRSPRNGFLLPREFIPLAEETGLIVPLGRWVLREACQTASAWRRASGTAPLPFVSINIADRQLREPAFFDEVVRVLAETGLEPHRLEIEITESTVMTDVPATQRTLRELRRLGVRVALDDFGTGYSSFSRLRRLPLDRLKIDRSFVVRLGEDRGNLAIVRAATTLGHDLKVSVTAEGIENAHQVAWLRSLGVDWGQGFYFARPCDAASTTKLVADDVHLPRREDAVTETDEAEIPCATPVI
ncbi:MAG: EAL domain-containing protein [Chloroflexota bacterium]|nr:EAL domain-containing protein [Chloroflexota bacterium]